MSVIDCFMSAVDIINANQGFGMVLLTAVYAIATGFILLYNMKTIKEMQETREAELRPYILASLDNGYPSGSGVYFQIKNYGKRGAKIDSVTISPNLRFYNEALSENFLKNVVLAPSQALKRFTIREEVIKESNYAVKIQYTSLDDNKKQYKENYTLMSPFDHGINYTDTKMNLNTYSNEAKALRDIANHLNDIKRKL